MVIERMYPSSSIISIQKVAGWPKYYWTMALFMCKKRRLLRNVLNTRWGPFTTSSVCSSKYFYVLSFMYRILIISIHFSTFYYSLFLSEKKKNLGILGRTWPSKQIPIFYPHNYRYIFLDFYLKILPGSMDTSFCISFELIVPINYGCGWIFQLIEIFQALIVGLKIDIP